MLFVLGVVVGLLIAVLIVAVLTFFRRVIENRVEIVQKQVEVRGPKPKGYVIEPIDEADDVRDAVVEKNRRDGRDTPIEDLL